MLNPGVYVFGLIFFAFCFSLSISNSRQSGSLAPPVRPAGMTAAGVSPLMAMASWRSVVGRVGAPFCSLASRRRGGRPVAHLGFCPA
jgi:hypothetical protein